MIPRQSAVSLAFAGVVFLGLAACDPGVAPVFESSPAVRAAPPRATLQLAPPAPDVTGRGPAPCLVGAELAPGMGMDGIWERLGSEAVGAPDPATCLIQEAGVDFGSSGRGGTGADQTGATTRGIPTVLAASLPAAPSLVAPNGSVTGARPEFRWAASSTATWYLVYIRDSATATGTPRVSRWVTADDTGCGAGTGECSWTPDLDLAEGAGIWWILPWNASGNGVWSAGMAFSTSLTSGAPSAPSLTGPLGTVISRRPQFQWEPVSGATWYRVFARDAQTMSGTPRINLWFTAETAGCAGGSGGCAWTSNADLVDGTVVWWTQAWNEGSGLGGWSASGTFVVAATPAPPPPPTLLGPEGEETTNRPVFRWNAVSGATWYRIFIRDGQTASGDPRVNRWVTASDAGCGSGTGVCQWTVDADLSNGAGEWWAQSWRPDGSTAGQWSSGMAFSVDAPIPPPAAVLTSPSGSVDGPRPEFQWQAIPAATSYRVYIRDASTPGGVRIDQWVTASSAQCGDGTGSCSFIPSVDLAEGAGVWWIQTRNDFGDGPWGASMQFQVAPSIVLPPNPGSPAQSWTGNTMPLRIIEKPGPNPVGPVILTVVAGGESRSFYRASVSDAHARTIHVPRGMDLQIIAHFVPTATAGLGGWGFSALKIKGMRSSWGFSPDDVLSGNFSLWEPFTTSPGTPWGGSLQTICGGIGIPGPLENFWTYTIPAFLTEGSPGWPVDFFVVWLMDHQYPRSHC